MTTTDSEMMEDPVRPVIDDELVDRLMAQVDAEGLELLGPEGVLTELTSRILSRGLEVEMADHLGYEKGDPAGWGSGNNRNGSYPKTVQTDAGTVGVEMPRDRNATFEPQLIPKHQRRLRGFNELVISLVARGMTTRDTRAHLQEIYGVEVSAELISKVTDAIVPELRAWQQRPLDAVYPILYLDAIVRASRILVGTGSSPPRSAYRFSNMGTIKRSIAVTISTTRPITAVGYIIADRILERSSTCASIVSARRISVSSRRPPISPARTIDTYSSLNAFGNLAMASERLAPFSTSALTSRMVLDSARFCVCSTRMFNERSSDSPELIIVAN